MKVFLTNLTSKMEGLRCGILLLHMRIIMIIELDCRIAASYSVCVCCLLLISPVGNTSENVRLLFVHFVVGSLDISMTCFFLTSNTTECN